MKRAIYAGSFDVFTNGHNNILQRALKLFDQVIILVAESPTKSGLLDFDERIKVISEHFKDDDRIIVDHWSSLTADYARENNVRFLVRGLRPTGDFDSEYLLARINKELNGEIESIFLMADNKTDYISTSMVKEVWNHGGDISPFVPCTVLKFLKNKIS